MPMKGAPEGERWICRWGVVGTSHRGLTDGWWWWPSWTSYSGMPIWVLL